MGDVNLLDLVRAPPRGKGRGRRSRGRGPGCAAAKWLGKRKRPLALSAPVASAPPDNEVAVRPDRLSENFALPASGDIAVVR